MRTPTPLLLLASGAFFLWACGSTQPVVVSEPETPVSPAQSTPVPTPESPVAPTPSEPTVFLPVPERDTIAIVQPCHPQNIASFNYRRLHHCTDSLAKNGDFESAIRLLQMQIDARNNPDQIGRRTLQLARYLDAAGRSREAAKVLEDFLVYKPVINEWMDSALALETKFQQARQKENQAYTSLVKQIRNLGAVQADYDQVLLLTDSLRSLKPGDSLVSWSKAQDELALQRSLARIQEQTSKIRTLVNDRAAFPEALAASQTLQRKYPSLVEPTGLKELHLWIESQQKLYGQDADAAYWSSRSPRDTLKVARALLERKKYTEARVYYKKLLASPLRKEAREDLNVLSEAFCEDQRKIAADRFAVARRSPKNAVSLLNEAIGALDRCLAEIPEGPMAVKVRQNKELLEQEKSKQAPAQP